VAVVAVAGATGGATARAAALAVDPGWPETSADAVDPGWRPAPPPEPVRATAADLGPLAAAPRSRAAAEDAVVVHRGDTLWDVAARHLRGAATDAQVAAEWPRWYAANRAVIGADPHHIVPGMRLLPPGSPS
jgi:nucleoid-associated protein YgaU